MDTKGTDFTTMFIYIAMAILGVYILTNLSISFSVFSILRGMSSVVILFGYYLLTKKQKKGFLIMWLGTLIYFLILCLFGNDGAPLTILMSSEFLLNIFVTFAVTAKLKTMS